MLSPNDIGRSFVMTVDVDGWSSLLGFYSVNHNPSTADAEVSAEKGLSILLDIFKKHDIYATFFVSGDMIRRHPDKIREILKEGHEIGCHGLLHKKNEFLTPLSEQRSVIEEATRLIEKELGFRPVGFRAPCLRSNGDTFIALQEHGYLYDSSMIPTFVPGYYGHLNFNFKPYWVALNNGKSGRHGRFLELPVSVNPFIPLSLSAAWMRNLGLSWVKFGVKANLLQRNSVVFYVHPRDVLSLPRVEGVPWHLYRNIGVKSIHMLNEILRYAKSLDAVFVKAVDLAQSIM